MEPDLSSLISQKNKILENIGNLNNNIQQAKNELELIKTAILKTCNHDWKKDMGSYGPYEKPDYYCEKCGSIDYRW